MEITACPKCGCRNFIVPNNKEKELPAKGICKECGYNGLLKIWDEYVGIFQGLQPPVPGLLGPWKIIVLMEKGEKKNLSALWEDARDCIKSLNLKKGDKIKVIIDEKVWCIERYENDETS